MVSKSFELPCLIKDSLAGANGTCGCEWYYRDVKAKGCQKIPAHVQERKQILKRCDKARPGDVYADVTELRKPAFTATDSMKDKCSECG